MTMMQQAKRKYFGVLRRIIRKVAPGWLMVPDIYGRSSHKQRDIRNDGAFMRLAMSVVNSGRSTLYYDRLYNIYQAIGNVARLRGGDCRPLRLLEVGVFKGGGSEFIARCARSAWAAPIEQYAVDTFSGHDAADLIGGIDAHHRPGTFQETSFEGVRRHLSQYPFVKVVQGRIQEVYSEISHGTWDFMHLDVDIASPTEYVLQQAGRDLAVGGAIVIDDYDFLSCPGIKEVVDEFCATHPDFVGMALNTGQFALFRLVASGMPQSSERTAPC